MPAPLDGAGLIELSRLSAPRNSRSWVIGTVERGPWIHDLEERCQSIGPPSTLYRRMRERICSACGPMLRYAPLLPLDVCTGRFSVHEGKQLSLLWSQRLREAQEVLRNHPNESSAWAVNIGDKKERHGDRQRQN